MREDSSATGVTTRTYDELDHILDRTDALGRKVSHGYDGLGRLAQRVTPDGMTTYTYDDPGVPNARGRLTRAEGPWGGRTVDAYDVLGRATRLGRMPAGLEHPFVEERSYDLGGRLADHTLPDLSVVTYEHGVHGLRRVLRDGVEQARFEDFTAWSRPQRVQAKVAASVARQDDLGQLRELAHLRGALVQGETLAQALARANLFHQTYAYDSHGNVLSTTEGIGSLGATDPGSFTYAYDGLDRLTSATDGTGAASPFTYDIRGNITRRGRGLALEYVDREVRTKLPTELCRRDPLTGRTSAVSTAPLGLVTGAEAARWNLPFQGEVGHHLFRFAPEGGSAIGCMISAREIRFRLITEASV